MMRQFSGSFFKKVMGMQAKRMDLRPKLKKRSRIRGKRTRVSKLKAGPVISLDVFRVVLEADAGRNSSDQGGEEVFDVFLTDLSKSQLSKLQQKIEKLCSAYLVNSKEHNTLEKARMVIRNAVDRRMEKSRKEEFGFCASIQKKLKRIEIEEISYSKSGKPEYFLIGEQWLSLRQFIRRFFSNEVQEYQDKVLKGDIIVDHARFGGMGFVKRVLMLTWQEACSAVMH